MKRWLLLCFLGICPSSLSAQSGNIQGIVIDNNGIPVSGASIELMELSIYVVSDLEGRFTLLNLPEGSYALEIDFLGFSPLKNTADVTAGQTHFMLLALDPIGIRLDEVELVTKGITGQARALNTQKNSTRITNIVSTDQIGKFPDSNIGDALKRIPGIGMQVDQGEARNIIIRGLSPELNSVTINGSRIPSAEGDNRNVQLDLIPSDMIQTIEVNKSLTPDMDADALGGSVNLVTHSAPQGFRLSLTSGSGLNFISNKRIWNTSLLVGNRSGNNQFGWLLSASVNDNDFGSDNLEARWADSFAYNSGTVGSGGNPVLEEVQVEPYTRVLEISPNWIQRVRRSFAGNFDFSPDNNHRFFLKTIYNWRDDRENRFVFEQEVLAPEEIGPGDFTISDNRLSRFPVLVSRQTVGGVATRSSKNARLEDQRMQNYSLGGNHFWGTAEVDWLASFARASDRKNRERTAEFKSEYPVLPNFEDPKFPQLIPENPEDPTNLPDFNYDEIIEENKYTYEEDINFFVNAQMPLMLFNWEKGAIKFGVRGRLKSKARDNNFVAFDEADNFPTLADVPIKDLSDPGYLVGNQYQAGPFPSEIWLGELALNQGEEVPDEFLRQNFRVNEDVLATYILSKQKVFEDLEILAGIRVEHTLFKATANQITEGTPSASRSNARESYTNYLPGLHLNYRLSPRTQLKFAWTHSLSRPNYVDMVPSRDIVFSDREIFVGNSKLNPALSANFDVIGEHYFESVGILSMGFFHKNIRNFVYVFRGVTTDDSFGPGTQGFDVFQPLNGEEAALYGLEVALQRQLDFLPGIGKNMSMDLNYTYLNAKTEGIRDINGVEREDLDLADTPPHLFNASLAYEGKKFQARLSANYSAAYLNEVGGRAFEDLFYGRQFFLDFNMGYNISSQLRFYAGLNNITNQPLRFYQGSFKRTAQLGYYDLRLSFGLKYDIFTRKEP